MTTQASVAPQVVGHPGGRPCHRGRRILATIVDGLIFGALFTILSVDHDRRTAHTKRQGQGHLRRKGFKHLPGRGYWLQEQQVCSVAINPR
jgi:hypothetical protein